MACVWIECTVGSAEAGWGLLRPRHLKEAGCTSRVLSYFIMAVPFLEVGLIERVSRGEG